MVTLGTVPTVPFPDYFWNHSGALSHMHIACHIRESMPMQKHNSCQGMVAQTMPFLWRKQLYLFGFRRWMSDLFLPSAFYHSLCQCRPGLERPDLFSNCSILGTLSMEQFHSHLPTRLFWTVQNGSQSVLWSWFKSFMFQPFVRLTTFTKFSSVWQLKHELPYMVVFVYLKLSFRVSFLLMEFDRTLSVDNWSYWKVCCS